MVAEPGEDGGKYWCCRGGGRLNALNEDGSELGNGSTAATAATTSVSGTVADSSAPSAILATPARPASRVRGRGRGRASSGSGVAGGFESGGTNDTSVEVAQVAGRAVSRLQVRVRCREWGGSQAEAAGRGTRTTRAVTFFAATLVTVE